MTNNFRQIATLDIDGKPYNLRLTLGAMADVEDKLDLESIDQLGVLLSNRPKLRYMLVLLECLLMGGKNPLTLDQLKQSDIDISALGEAIAKCVGGGADPEKKSVGTPLAESQNLSPIELSPPTES